MTKEQILSLMMRQEHQVIDTDLYSLAALLAERLALISESLDEGALNRFIDIGAAIYRHGLGEFREGVPVEDLFPASENWASGPQPDAGGFRNSQ
jgi:hypothetical protein